MAVIMSKIFYEVSSIEDEHDWETFDTEDEARSYIKNNNLTEETHRLFMLSSDNYKKHFDTVLSFQIKKTDNKGQSHGHMLVEPKDKPKFKAVICSNEGKR
jgi:hypothetical protein